MGPRPCPLLPQRLPGPTDTQGRAGDSLEHKGGPQGPASCLSFSSWSNFNKLLQCWPEGRGERPLDAQRIYEVRQNWPKHEVLKFSSSSLKSALPSHHQAAPGTPRNRSRAHRATNQLSYSPALRSNSPSGPSLNGAQAVGGEGQLGLLRPWLHLGLAVVWHHVAHVYPSFSHVAVAQYSLWRDIDLYWCMKSGLIHSYPSQHLPST